MCGLSFEGTLKPSPSTSDVGQLPAHSITCSVLMTSIRVECTQVYEQQTTDPPVAQLWLRTYFIAASHRVRYRMGLDFKAVFWQARFGDKEGLCTFANGCPEGTTVGQPIIIFRVDSYVESWRATAAPRD